MLYALEHPASFGVLLLSLTVGLVMQGVTQAWVADRLGDRIPRQEGRLTFDPRRHVDPFGAVAALISGLGWARSVELPARARRRGALVLTGLVGPGTNVVLGIVLLLTWRLTAGPGDVFPTGAAFDLQHGLDLAGNPHLLLALAGASQLYLGALSLVPLPPLPGGRLMFALAPRTLGWMKAEHHLIERNIGVAILLALLILPLGGDVPLLPALLDIALTPVLSLLCGS